MNNAQIVKMNDIPLACEELAKSVTELDEVLTQFQNRLDGITRQEPLTGSGNCLANPSACELSGMIRDQVSRLRGMSERIRNHNSALEL